MIFHDFIISRFPKLFWRFRHIIDPHWAEAYSSNSAILHPHRTLLSDIVKAQNPTSIFEFGCASGANLLWATIDNPHARIYGYDVSRSARKTAKKFLSAYQNVAIYDSDDEWGSRFYDIVITDAVLIYFTPGQMEDVITKFKELTKKAIVLCEWSTDQESFLYQGHWCHNYRDILPNVEITKIPKETWPGGGWGRFGSMMVWKKEG